MARKPPEEKGPQAQWIVDQRQIRGWKVEQLHAELGKRGHSYTLGTVRGWEAGRPSKPGIRALEQLYGAKAPDAYTPAATPGDMAALVAALGEQTAAINRLIDFLGSDALDRSVQRVAARLGLLRSPDDEDAPEGTTEPRGNGRIEPQPSA